MSGASFRFGAAVFVAATLAVASAAHAQEIPALRQPSPAVAAANPQLVDRRTQLSAARDRLHAQVQDLNARCKDLPADSPQVAVCQADQNTIAAAIRAHIRDSNDYNATVQAATVAAAAPGYSDPSVVDPRATLTGLPPTVDAAIPDTPAGNRVRKGLEAIKAHDWTVARAWFQDAVNQEPGNEGLQRLVDLANFALQDQDKRKDLLPEVDDFNSNYLRTHPGAPGPKPTFVPPPATADPPAGWRRVFRYLFVAPPRDYGAPPPRG